jgi:peptidoglycan/LPS O-acetylase OafA/YrhL
LGGFLAGALAYRRSADLKSGYWALLIPAWVCLSGFLPITTASRQFWTVPAMALGAPSLNRLSAANALDQYFAKFSYPLYLIHVPVLYLLWIYFPKAPMSDLLPVWICFSVLGRLCAGEARRTPHGTAAAKHQAERIDAPIP